MKNMKKATAIFLMGMLMLVSLAGCGGNKQPAEEPVTIQIAGLKGPTTMGMVKLMEDSANGDAQNDYAFTMAGSADEITPSLVKGELDIAAVPANLASVLYHNTEGQVQILAVNTMGVLYLLDKGDSVQSLEDLRGKTVYMTGKGSVPEYGVRYILSQYGINPDEDVTLEFKSEPSEVLALMNATEEEVIAILPQPFATVAQTQVEGLRVVLDFNEPWNALDNGSALITGVLVVRSEFAQTYPQQLATFLEEYQASTQFANENIEDAAQLVEKYGIVKAPIAQKALPFCNITYMAGDEMKEAVSGYLQILFDQQPKSIGGALPGDDFYYGIK